MKDIVKNAIIETNFFDSMNEIYGYESSEFSIFENLSLTKSENLQFSKEHNLNEDDEILMLFKGAFFVEGDFWTADRTYTYSTVFLENRISFYKEEYKHGSGKENDWNSEIRYEHIDSIEVYEELIRFFYTKEYILELREYWQNVILEEKDSSLKKIYQNELDTCEYLDIGPKYFVLGNFIAQEPFVTFFNKLKEKINTIDDDFEGVKELYEETLNLAFESEDYNKALDIFQEYDFLEDYYFFKYDKAYALYMLNINDRCLELLDELIISAENQDVTYWVNKAKILKSAIIEESGDYYKALQIFNEGIENYEEKDSSGFYSPERSNELYQKYLDVFNELPYKDRKVIYITNSKEKFKSDSLTVLSANNLPDINFPAHHPINNETYIGHPYNHNLYIPIHNYDNELLIDKINEFCYLLQCLGAELITIENINSNNNSNNSSEQTDINFGLSGLKNGLEIDNKNTQKNSSENQINFRIGKNQTFNPVKFPYVPEDLTWLSNEAGWQRLIRQRLEGNLLEHNELIDSSQSQILNTNEINDLKVDLKLFIAKANVNVKKEIDLEIKNNVSSQWKVSVKFKPIDQFQIEATETNYIEITDSSNDQEIEFIDEYKFLNADGDLSERDLKILERLRIRLGITEERSVELIKNLSTYTEQEKELVEEIKFMLEDGEISERDQKILLRLSNKLNISEDRCIELINKLL